MREWPTLYFAFTDTFELRLKPIADGIGYVGVVQVRLNGAGDWTVLCNDDLDYDHLTFTVTAICSSVGLPTYKNKFFIVAIRTFDSPLL